MQKTVLGFCFAGALLVVAFGFRNSAPTNAYAANNLLANSSSGGMQVHVQQLPSGTQVITLVDTQNKALAVYHVKPSGQICLKSVRNVNADLQIDEFNIEKAEKPSPKDIREMLSKQ